ncbi:hypothetical protein IHE45_03G028000 [Dioscorea alata]|uniref:Uncharacterized protein n=1 Tax=Dioscorea alata TaxID=55571 RepID=A0ACB7WJE5_DIOAL|nr:hypothetical protein IHE45_03G028000 [Dioscorea alata]
MSSKPSTPRATSSSSASLSLSSPLTLITSFPSSSSASLNCQRIVKRLEAFTLEISRIPGLLPLASLDLSSCVSDEIKELCEIMERVEFRVAVAEEENP